MRTRSIRSLMTFIVVLVPSLAGAQGLFDFLDPCIGARNDYWQARSQILSQIDTKLASVANAEPTEQFKAFWWNEKRTLMRKYFDDNISAILRTAGVKDGKTMDAAFETWLENQIHSAGGHEAMDKLASQEYRRVLKLALDKQKGETIAELDKQRGELYSACPQDVANQMFRGLVTVTVAPVGLMTRNIEIAQRESGAVAKVLAGTTGISVDAIVQNKSPLGGENSEARRACNAVAGVFGGKC